MQVEIQIFNGKRYHRNVEKGERYFMRGKNPLHRVVWTFYNGEIPKGYHVHHKDGNLANNDISNLALMKGSEHLRLHMAERMQNPEYMQFLRDNFNKARFYASIWHGSPEGIEWHKKQAQNTLRKIQPQKFICEYCGKEFSSKPNGSNRFCSNKCKSAYRLHAGLDNETRVCVICGKEFTINKYYKIRTCGRKCGAKLLSLETKGKTVKPLPLKEVFCVDCGKSMMVSAYSTRKRCPECQKKRSVVKSVCEICGREFEHSKYNNARFCSVECVGKYNSIRVRKSN